MAKDKRRQYDDDISDALKKMGEGSASGSIRLPDGLERFKPEQPGEYEFDVIPYEVEEGNPHREAGKMWWERTFWVHQRLGPDEKDVVCLRQTFHKPCPICEEQARLKSKTERDDVQGMEVVKALRAKMRTIILLRMKGEKQVRVYEDSFHSFCRTMLDKLEAAGVKDGRGYRKFWHPAGGLTVRARFRNEKVGNGNWLKATNIELDPRDRDIPDSLVDSFPPGVLDRMPVELSYAKAQAILTGQVEDDREERPARRAAPRDDADDVDPPRGRAASPAEDDEDPPHKPANGRRAAAKDEEEDPPARGKGRKPAKDEEVTKTPEIGVGDFVKHPKLGRCKVIHISGDGSMLKLEDGDAEIHKGVDADEVSVTADDPPPKTKGGKPADDDDGGWGDEPETPPRKRK